jgi:serine/threonine-protein kinase RsbW
LEFPKHAHIQVNTDLNALFKVLTWFEQFKSMMSPTVWTQCQLALAEGFTNAVRHAHRDQPFETPIEIEVTVFEQTLEIRIWDLGPKFDLDQHIDALSMEVDREAEGGRGLKLMKQIADILTYTRTLDERNCLLIVKHYP